MKVLQRVQGNEVEGLIYFGVKIFEVYAYKRSLKHKDCI